MAEHKMARPEKESTVVFTKFVLKLAKQNGFQKSPSVSEHSMQMALLGRSMSSVSTISGPILKDFQNFMIGPSFQIFTVIGRIGQRRNYRCSSKYLSLQSCKLTLLEE
jgi:hypothetical protein